MLRQETLKKLENIKKVFEFMKEHKDYLHSHDYNVYSVARTIASVPGGLRKSDFVEKIESGNSTEQCVYDLLLVHENNACQKLKDSKADIMNHLGLFVKVKTNDAEQQASDRVGKTPDLFNSSAMSADEIRELVSKSVRESMAQALRIMLHVVEENVKEDKQ